MSVAEWTDLLDGFTYVFAQPIYDALAVFLALMILAPILRFVMEAFSSSRNRGD
jgi:hypothetical protein